MMEKNDHYLSKHLYYHCYNGIGLGIPSEGLNGSPLLEGEQSQRIELLKKYHQDHFFKNDLIISAAGIKDHDEFVSLVEQKLKGIQFYGFLSF